MINKVLLLLLCSTLDAEMACKETQSAACTWILCQSVLLKPLRLRLELNTGKLDNQYLWANLARTYCHFPGKTPLRIKDCKHVLLCMY